MTDDERVCEIRCGGSVTCQPRDWTRIFAVAPTCGDYPAPAWILDPPGHSAIPSWLPIDDPDAGYEFRVNYAEADLEDVVAILVPLNPLVPLDEGAVVLYARLRALGDAALGTEENTDDHPI